MVALHPNPAEPSRGRTHDRRPPLIWRFLILVDRLLVAITGRLVVTGDIPAHLRGKPLILAANHIGNFDVMVLIAACNRIGVAPRFLATGGLFEAPVAGAIMSACGHVRVDRGKSNVVEALGRAVDALGDGDPILVYPEGRISRDPGLWPERGKTGPARMALSAGVPVIPLSQWGAHEAMWWGTLAVGSWADFAILMKSWLRAARTRPVMRVHFGDPVELADLSAGRPGDAVRARDRIMRAIAGGLADLRRDEWDQPRFWDPTRPVESSSPWKPDRP
ncbi:1-acyl-sn-glycerol-3-phosphate acyltransferase [Pseudonocardiaceae bacterium YIM PH 21723]|nr:1-acyl-sn-glycerol-3-phosphate acyltransferase [Pseudonocardiaceae bacterium YIM PH 21723]